jgi:glutathione S-transferase
MPALKYTYFNLRGRGETVRLCLAYGGLKYEDKRVEFKDWPQLKATTPWGTLPVLEVDGRPIGQSMTIARYVAREAGLAGSNSVEQALIDSVVDATTDFREKMIETHFKPEDQKAAAQKEFQEKTIAVVLPNLEKFATANKAKPGFFVGSKTSLADVHFFSIMEILQSSAPNVLSTYPTLKKIFDNVAANPKIVEYIKNRPQTPF